MMTHKAQPGPLPGPWRWQDGYLYDEHGRFLVSSFAEDGSEGMAPDSDNYWYAVLLMQAPEIFKLLLECEGYLALMLDEACLEKGRRSGDDGEAALLERIRGVLALVPQGGTCAVAGRIAMAEQPLCPNCQQPLEVRQYQYEVLVWEWDEAASRYQKRVTGEGADAPECGRCGHRDWSFLLDTTDDDGTYDYEGLGLHI